MATADPPRRRWTCAEFERAVDLGLFGSEERLELIEGDIIDKMAQNPPHAVALDLAEACVRSAFPGHYIRGQKPLALDDTNQPEPDLAVVVGQPRDYIRSHPTSAVFVIEVADSSLAYDRGVKAALYARAGVPEYWIVNLCDRIVEVHRGPGPMKEQPLGFSYREVTRHAETDVIAPLQAAEMRIAVKDLLP